MPTHLIRSVWCGLALHCDLVGTSFDRIPAPRLRTGTCRTTKYSAWAPGCGVTTSHATSPTSTRAALRKKLSLRECDMFVCAFEVVVDKQIILLAALSWCCAGVRAVSSPWYRSKSDRTFTHSRSLQCTHRMSLSFFQCFRPYLVLLTRTLRLLQFRRLAVHCSSVFLRWSRIYLLDAGL